MLLYPAIDLHRGHVVRLYQGDFAQEQRYALDPVELAKAYAAAGARWLHVVDLDGARSGHPAHLDVIARICRETALSVQTGGGARSEAALDALYAAGVARVVVGSLAVTDPTRVIGWLERYGPERITLALDALADEWGIWHVQVAGWTAPAPLTLNDALTRYAAHGARHILSTDISRDGTLAGPNLALYRELASRWPAIAVQASGGVGTLDDLAALEQVGARGVVIGKALLDGRFTLDQALALPGMVAA